MTLDKDGEKPTNEVVRPEFLDEEYYRVEGEMIMKEPVPYGSPPLEAESSQPPADARPERVTYRNWRGEVAERVITPIRVWFGSTEWHPEPQWFLRAMDEEKGAERDFALRDFMGGAV